MATVLLSLLYRPTLTELSQPGADGCENWGSLVLPACPRTHAGGQQEPSAPAGRQRQPVADRTSPALGTSRRVIGETATPGDGVSRASATIGIVTQPCARAADWV